MKKLIVMMLLLNSLLLAVDKNEPSNLYDFTSDGFHGATPGKAKVDIQDKKNKILVVFISSESNQQIQALGSYL